MASIFSVNDTASESFSSTDSPEVCGPSRERSLSTPYDSSLPSRGHGLQPKRPLVYSSTTENPSIGPEGKTVPENLLNGLSERSLAMHLFRSFQNVMSTQESMWEELKDWARNKADVLRELGWDNDDNLEEPSIRRNFEALLEKYQG